MEGINQLIFSFIIIFAQLTFSLPNSDNICTQFTNHHDVFRSFDYPISIQNTINENNDLSYAKTDRDSEIVFIQIVNQQFIPSTISCFPYLTEIRIIRVKFFSLKDFPCALRELYLSHVDMSNRFEDLNRFSHLERLTITHTNLDSTQFLGSLRRLVSLTLNYNNINSLSSSITQIKSLIYLDVSFNPRLRSLDGINGHSKLQRVIAASCAITKSPKNLTQLNILRLENNLLKSLDNIETLGQETGEAKLFFFENNQIRFLTVRLNEIKNLHTINLNGNRIDIFPKRILCGLKQLKCLFIRQNPVSNSDHYTDDIKDLQHCLPNTKIN